MELRKDPITRSWVMVGPPDDAESPVESCPFCPAALATTPLLLALPLGAPTQVSVLPHPQPLFRIEGGPGRSAEGIYDHMNAVGAHEIVVETADHFRSLADLRDDEINLVLQAFGLRIADLKRDSRFKYITAFSNQGALAGQEWAHANSELTATPFVPRRILYELRSCREWFKEHERCVFCDIVRQEEKKGRRVVDSQGDYVAFCPYASRLPYEVWILPRPHNHCFETPRAAATRRNLAALLGRVLRRLRQVSQAYHLVLHTAPNTQVKKGSLSGYWTTIAQDYHWHIEILPIVETRSKSYSLKEAYFNSLPPEDAAEQLRHLDVSL